MTLDDVRDAARALEGVAVRTALRTVPTAGGGRILVKCEFEQPVGAFKLRGAFTAVNRLGDADRARGVITHSSGNHARALAWAARRFGIPALIVMPADAPAVKVAGVRAEGAEIDFVTDRRDRDPRCRALAAERGMVMIPPYEHPDVIAGQGTVALEILDECAAPEAVFVPVGGGGLLAGMTAVLRALSPTTRIVGVEPEGAPKLSAALAAGQPAATASPHSVADGLLPPMLGTLPWSVIGPAGVDAVTVSDDEIRQAVRYLYREAGLTVEPSGAAAFAPLLRDNGGMQGTAVAVLSGGNVDPELFQQLVA